MAHRYGQMILIRHAPNERAGTSGTGAPAAFAWRGVWYQVDAVMATWRLRDRWWGAPAADVVDGYAAPFADTQTPTERAYYRVLCRDPEGEQVFDLYYDNASGRWMLDRAHD